MTIIISEMRLEDSRIMIKNNTYINLDYWKIFTTPLMIFLQMGQSAFISINRSAHVLQKPP